MRQLTQLVVMVMAVLTMGSLTQQSEGEVYTLQGSKIEVRFAPEKSAILLGEPVYLEFSITNLSDHTLHLIVGKEHIPGAGNRSRFAFAAIREEDRTRILPPPPPGSGTAYNALVGPNDLLPHKPYLFYLFLPHELPLTRPGTYTIGCGKLLEVLKPLPDGSWDMRHKPDAAYVELKTQLTVLPTDRAGMGRVIDQLGQAAIVDYRDSGARQAAAWRAADSLAAIADQRTIPWLIRLLACREGIRKSQALDALSRFNDPRAYAAIKSGLSLLKSLRHHPDEGIRLQVVQFFGNRTGTEAEAVLRELAHDKSGSVRDEAIRYLRLHAPRSSA